MKLKEIQKQCTLSDWGQDGQSGQTVIHSHTLTLSAIPSESGQVHEPLYPSRANSDRPGATCGPVYTCDSNGCLNRWKDMTTLRCQYCGKKARRVR